MISRAPSPSKRALQTGLTGRAPAALVAMLMAVLAAVAITACGSSSHKSSTTTRALANVPIEAPCQQIAAVLSNGPDPDADPVGYAQAQVLQLRQLKLGKPKLEHAIGALASAYERFSKTGGDKAAKATVAAASKAVNTFCPGATS